MSTGKDSIHNGSDSDLGPGTPWWGRFLARLASRDGVMAMLFTAIVGTVLYLFVTLTFWGMREGTTFLTATAANGAKTAEAAKTNAEAVKSQAEILGSMKNLLADQNTYHEKLSDRLDKSHDKMTAIADELKRSVIGNGEIIKALSEDEKARLRLTEEMVSIMRRQEGRGPQVPAAPASKSPQ